MGDGSKEPQRMTSGLDLGDRYSHLCLLDTRSGEIIEENRLRSTSEAFRRRFDSERPMRIAIEAGTHSPWVSRLLEECGHEVLVANARKVGLSSMATDARTTDSTPRTWLVLPGWIRSCLPRSNTEAKLPRPTWRSSARARHSSKQELSSSTTSEERSSHLGLACPAAPRRPSTKRWEHTCRSL
jgi:hypothetical protein